MKKGNFPVISVLVILVLVTLSCNLPFSKEEKAEDNQVVSKQKMNKDLGDLYRSVDGGYSFQVIPDFELEENWGISYMYPEDADPDAGPMFILIGGTNDVEKTPDDLKEDFLLGFDGEMEISKGKKVKIDGKEGVLVEYETQNNGKDVKGQAIFVAVTPYQVFSLIDLYPPGQYKSKQKDLFMAVSESVRFFEPSVAGLSDDPGFSSQTGQSGEEIRQWGIYAFASSEYDFERNSAFQAIGEPDTPECGDYETAWSSLEKFTEEWIEVGYMEPVRPTEVTIYETHVPSQVVKVELMDQDWVYHEVYSATPVMTGCPNKLTIPITDANYLVTAVRITIDQSQLNLPWAQIDAVELVGFRDDSLNAYIIEDDPGSQGDSPSGPVVGSEFVAPETVSGFWDYFRVEDGLADPIVRALAVAPDGSLWIGYGNKGIANLKNGKFTNYTTDQGLTANGVTSLAVESDGTLWVGTTWGISRFDGSKFTNYLTDQGLLSNDVKSLAIGRDGTLWVGVSSGVSQFDGSTWKNYTMDNGLIDKPVVDIAFDFDQGVWFATKSGVSRLRDGVWKSYTEADGLSYKTVQSIAVTFDGAIWFATSGQGASRFDGTSWTVFKTDEGLTYNTKDSIIADDGAIWFSSDGYGIFRYNGSSFQNWTMKDGLPSDWVDIITVGPDGSIWAGFKNEGIGRFGN